MSYVCNTGHKGEVVELSADRVWTRNESERNFLGQVNTRLEIEKSEEGLPIKLPSLTAKKWMPDDPPPHLQTHTHTPRQRASSDAYTLQPQCVLKNTPGLGLSTVFFETLFSTSFCFITTVCFLAVVGVYNKLLSESRFVPAGKGLGMITSVGSPQVLFGSNSDVHSCSVALQLTKD